MEKLKKLISSLIEARFYGEVLIKFTDGKVTIIKKTENIKI